MPGEESLAERLRERIAGSPEAESLLGLMGGGEGGLQGRLKDLFTLTVRTSSQQPGRSPEVVTEWSVDGDIETTVKPDATGLTDALVHLHMQEVDRAVEARLRLIEAVLRLAKLDVHLL